MIVEKKLFNDTLQNALTPKQAEKVLNEANVYHRDDEYFDISPKELKRALDNNNAWKNQNKKYWTHCILL